MKKSLVRNRKSNEASSLGSESILVWTSIDRTIANCIDHTYTTERPENGSFVRAIDFQYNAGAGQVRATERSCQVYQLSCQVGELLEHRDSGREFAFSDHVDQFNPIKSGCRNGK